jgi:hypothetical protein
MELLKQISTAVAGLAGAAAAAYVLSDGSGPYGAADKAFASRGGDVVRTYPELAALTRSENAASLKALGAAKTREEKLNVAVQVFMGFWMINGEALRDLCRQSGVDMTMYVDKFQRRNARQHEKAAAYLDEAGLNEQRLYKSRRGDMMQKLRINMLYMDGGMQAMATSDACQMMLADTTKYVGKLDFRVLDPAMNQILLGS